MVEIVFDKDEDWEKRTLCSDESCIGTIGTDGRCRECGKPYNGVLNTTNFAGEVPVKTSLKEIVDQPQNHEISKISVSEGSISDDDWEQRVLCSDGCCIGTIGHDGRCRECGKPK